MEEDQKIDLSPETEEDWPPKDYNQSGYTLRETCIGFVRYIAFGCGIRIVVLVVFALLLLLAPHCDTHEKAAPEWHRAESREEVLRRVKDKVVEELSSIGLDASNIVANAMAHPTRLRAVVPEHTRSRWLVLSTNDEALITRKFAKEREKLYLFDDTPGKIARIRAIAQRLVAVIPEIDSVPEIHILKDDSVNACCLPDGTIFVNDGTLKEISDDSLLAAILAHELGHAAARHGNECTTYLLIGAAGGVAFEEWIAGVVPVLNSGTNVSLIRRVYRIGADAAFHLPMARCQELEADRLGVRYLARAGFDPEAAVRLFEYFKKIESQKPAVISSLLSAHPVNDKRIEHVRKVLAEPDLYEMPKKTWRDRIKKRVDEVDFTKASEAVLDWMAKPHRKPELPSSLGAPGSDSKNE